MSGEGIDSEFMVEVVNVNYRNVDRLLVAQHRRHDRLSLNRRRIQMKTSRRVYRTCMVTSATVGSSVTSSKLLNSSKTHETDSALRWCRSTSIGSIGLASAIIRASMCIS